MSETEVTSRWRWVILSSSFLSLLITGYAQYHVGVMKVALLRHRDYDVSTVTWLMSYYAGSFALTAPVGSLVLNLTSCRTCVILSGIFCLLGFVLSSLVTDVVLLFFAITLLGMGQGMCNTGPFVVLGYNFPKHSSIALGVSVSGGALGIFLHPPLLQALVDWYGLQGALMLSGAIAFHASALGALMRPNSLELMATQSRRGVNALQKLCSLFADVTNLHKSPLTSRAMAVFLMSVFSMSLAFHSLLVLLPYHLIHVGGLTSTEASFSVSVSGTGSFLSRLMAGFLSHDPRVGPVLVYSGLIGVQALVSLTAPSLIAQGIVGSYVYSFMVGLYSGGVFTLYYPILLQVAGLRHVPTALGIAFFSFGVGGIVGAPFTELVASQNSHPYVMFGFIGALFCVSAILGSLVTSLLPPTMESTADQHKPSSSSSSSSSSASLSDQGPRHDLHLKETRPRNLQTQHNLFNSEVVIFAPAEKPTGSSSEKVHDGEAPEVTKPLLDGADCGHVIEEHKV